MARVIRQYREKRKSLRVYLRVSVVRIVHGNGCRKLKTLFSDLLYARKLVFCYLQNAFAYCFRLRFVKITRRGDVVGNNVLRSLFETKEASDFPECLTYFNFCQNTNIHKELHMHKHY